MDAFKFSRDDVIALAAKLDSPQLRLKPEERALLIAVFAVARENVVRVAIGPAQPEPTAADLKEQILSAFLPADGNEFVMFPARISGDPFE
jgi:hypothetical protein